MSGGTPADAFDSAGYGGNPVGFGRKTAVVVVDFQLGFTDPAYRMGRSPYTQAAVETASATLKQARALGVPVLHTVVEYGSLADVGNWKTRGLEDFTPGSEMVKVDPRVWAEGDVLVKKHFPSAFFGTDTASILRFWDVDTVVIMGCTTSGCVRATVIDSFSHGFRTIVADDCCGDHDPATHASNLQDVERRYADVLTAAEILQQLERPAQLAPAAELAEAL
jgi:maleamate amidohydrolase